MTGPSSEFSRRLLAVAAMGAALLLLGGLLLLSSNPQQVPLKHADQRLTYLATAADALAQQLAGGAVAELDPAALDVLRENMTAVADAVTGDLNGVYGRGQGLETLRRQLLGSFSALRDLDTVAAAEFEVLIASLAGDWSALGERLRRLAQTQTTALAAAATLTSGTRELVASLRLRGRSELASSLYEAERTLHRSLSRNPLAVAQREGALLPVAMNSLSRSDREVLETLEATSRTLVAARSELGRMTDGLAIPAFATAVKVLRDEVSRDTLARLAVVNEARILLNMYTLLLLGLLAFFGFRLARSYQALNRSHDDLEERVQERTQDLERALSELKESQTQLVQAEKLSSLGQLVAGVMHEINTPLLYVQNNASVTAELAEELKDYLLLTLPVLKADDLAAAQAAATTVYRHRERFSAELLKATAEDLKELSGDSVDGLNQITELVQSLKDFSRLDRAAEDLFDVREGLEKTLVMTRNLLKAGVEVKKDFGDVPQIRCAPSQINQIFVNLINNAVQAMDGKGCLTLSTRDAGEWVEIIIGDNGCGIEPEHLNQIMDPFFTTKPVGQGTGLGLSIVHKIVYDHGGQILVDSKPGVGTRFTIGLPAAGATPQRRPLLNARSGEEAA